MDGRGGGLDNDMMGLHVLRRVPYAKVGKVK